MRKFLSHFRRGSERAADDRREFARKLAAFRKSTGKSERFVLPCACAVQDAGFIVLFERVDPNDKFRITAIETEPVRSTANGTPHPRILNPDDIDTGGWRCPHCGDTSGFVLCGRCRMVICGRSVRSVAGTEEFACRPSCGATGSLGPLLEVAGQDVPVSAGHADRMIGAAPQFTTPLLGRPRR